MELIFSTWQQRFFAVRANSSHVDVYIPDVEVSPYLDITIAALI